MYVSWNRASSYDVLSEHVGRVYGCYDEPRWQVEGKASWHREQRFLNTEVMVYVFRQRLLETSRSAAFGCLHDKRQKHLTTANSQSQGEISVNDGFIKVN